MKGIKGLLMGACLAMAPLGAAAQVASFTVEGQGDTVFAARQDAIRTALQQQVDQLIVADRVVANDKLVLDRVMSTMNGYVERFEILEQSAMGDGVQLTARIAISDSMITNYISRFRSDGSSVDGGKIFGEIQRRNAQDDADRLRREANGRIFDRLFTGFPAEVTRVELVDVQLLEADDVGWNMQEEVESGDWVRLRLRLGFDPAFLEAVRTTVRTFEVAECFETGKYSDKMRREPVKIDGVTVYEPRQLAKHRGGHPNFDCTPDIPMEHLACLGEADRTRCFVMEPGDYTRSWARNPVRWPQATLYMAFTDAQGRGAMTSENCIQAELSGLESNFMSDTLPFYGEFYYGGTTHFAVDAMPFLTEVDINTAQVDMARADEFHGIIGLKGGVLDLMPIPGARDLEGCDKLREAIVLSR